MARTRHTWAVGTLSIRDFTADEAQRASAWSYKPPFEIYNADPEDSEMFLARSDTVAKSIEVRAR